MKEVQVQENSDSAQPAGGADPQDAEWNGMSGNNVSFSAMEKVDTWRQVQFIRLKASSGHAED